MIRRILLSAVLGIGAIAGLTLTPASADAHPHCAVPVCRPVYRPLYHHYHGYYGTRIVVPAPIVVARPACPAPVVVVPAPTCAPAPVVLPCPR
jgi:hypothetical protein